MSFVKEFVDYAASRTDAPKDWHIYAALSALSVALGTGTWADGRSRAIYPNIWCVNIGPSGFGKSVPLDLVTMLLRRAGLEKHMLPDTFSLEALYDVLAAEPTRIAVMQEFGSFMDMLGREYMAGAQKAITNWYDVPDDDVRQLRSGIKPIKKPFITILGASTPEWFADSFKADMLRGGFLARFLFCPAEKRGAHVEHPGPHRDAVLDGMADHLRLVRDSALGRADFSKVLRKFNEWDREQRAHISDVDPQLGGIASRGSVLVQKATMLFHASADPYSTTPEAADLDNAIKFVERSHRMAFTYLTEKVAHNRDDKDALRVLEIVRTRGGECVPRALVLRDSHLSAPSLDRAERTLVESGRLVMSMGNVAGSVRPSKLYSLGPVISVSKTAVKLV